VIAVTALFGAGVGIGLRIVVRAIVPKPAPLAAVFASLERTSEPGSVSVDASSMSGIERRTGRLALRIVEGLGSDLEARAVELRLTDRTAARHALDKLVGAVGGAAVPLLIGAGTSTLGIMLPVAGVLGLSGATLVAGWLLPDMVLRDDAAKRRKAFRHALSSYLDLVNVIIAGGGGIQTALYTAAEAGDGWAFASIRRALDRARLTNRSPWATFAELAGELDVPELAELAASVALAGSQGARIRASLAAKADTLRGHQIAETEAAAESATERMTIPVAVLLFGFLLFVAYPAVQQITTVSGPAGP
jgi:Flp pilus assembly protein TadB